MEFRQLLEHTFLRHQCLHALEHRCRLLLRIAHLSCQRRRVEAVHAFGTVRRYLTGGGGERDDGARWGLNFCKTGRREHGAERVVTARIENNELVAHFGLVHGVQYLRHRHRIEGN